MLLRFVRDLLVEAVWAGALTALVLHSYIIGVALLVLGLVQLELIRRGRRSLLLVQASNTSSTGL